MGLFSKIKNALKKTREGLSGALSKLLKSATIFTRSWKKF